MSVGSLRRSIVAGLTAVGRLARREPVGAFGFLILLVWSVIAVGAIGSGGGWLGVGRYDNQEVFKTLNIEFAHLKAAAALDGSPSDISQKQIKDLLAAPDVYGPFADSTEVQGMIQDYLQPLVAEGELIPLLSAGRSPYIEVAGGAIQQVDQGFSGDANRPLVINSLQPPSAAHWFGTNQGGNDIYSVIVDHAWRILYVGFLAALVGVAGGVILALAAQPLRGTRIGGAVAAAIGSVLDGLLALPPLILLILAVFGHGPRDFALILPLAAFALPLVWRRFSESDSGITPTALITVFRNVMVIAMISEAALSFIGFSEGWGLLAALGRQFIFDAPWLTLFAGLAITSVLLGVYALGYGLGNLVDAGNSEAS